MRKARWFALVVTCGLVYAVIIGGRSTSAPAAAQGQPEVNPFTLKIGCGLKGAQPTVWEGSVRATHANVSSVEGWRFLPNEDHITAPNSWRLRTDLNPQPANQPTPANPTTPNGVLVFGTASQGASFDVTTNRGAFSFRLSDSKLGRPLEQLNGEASVELLPATTKLTDDLREDDFPSSPLTPMAQRGRCGSLTAACATRCVCAAMRMDAGTLSPACPMPQAMCGVRRWRLTRTTTSGLSGRSRSRATGTSTPAPLMGSSGSRRFG